MVVCLSCVVAKCACSQRFITLSVSLIFHCERKSFFFYFVDTPTPAEGQVELFSFVKFQKYFKKLANDVKQLVERKRRKCLIKLYHYQIEHEAAE